MKNLILCIFFITPGLMNTSSAQNIAINTDGSLPDASAMMDIASTTKGFLAPRMTTVQQNAISLPAKGLLIYNTTDNVFKVNTGTAASPVWTSLTASSNNWLLTGNSGTNATNNFLGTTDNTNMVFRTNNQQRMVVDGSGRVGIGVTNPANPLVVKDTFEIRRTASVAQLLFTNTAGAGDFRIGGDGSDIFWQGGGGRNLQMGAYWGIQLMGDRQSGTFPSFANGVANTGVLVQAQRDASVPLAIQSNSASQTANLTEWRNAAGTVLDIVDENGSVAIGTNTFNATYPEKLLVDAGTTSSVNAIVGKGSINSYLQLNIQNNSSGTSASSDVVATANNGNETTNYVDMGINGGSYSGGVMGSANDSYLYNMGQNFLIGTGTASKSLVFMTGGTSQATNERMRIDGNGNVGIGATSFNGTYPEQLLVDAGTTTSVNAIVGKGSIDSYLQLNIQNNSSGTSASSDVVATANNGNETTNYVDMGINGGSYSGGVMGGANDSYMYNMGQNFLIGTGTASKSLVFMTGGTSQASNERMRIDGTGNVGIKTNSPTSTLQVAGSVSTAITTKTATYTATANDYTIICNNTSGNITINLPAASGASGRIYVIKRIGSLYSVTLDGAGSDTIDGSLTKVLSFQYSSVMIQSDGSNWFILSSY